MSPPAALTALANCTSLVEAVKAGRVDLDAVMERVALKRERDAALTESELFSALFAWARSDGNVLAPSRLPRAFIERVKAMAANGTGPPIDEALLYLRHCEAEDAAQEAELELQAGLEDDALAPGVVAERLERYEAARRARRDVYDEERRLRKAWQRGSKIGARLVIVRRRSGGERRPGARRVTSRSAGGGSSGDPDEPEPPGEHLAGRRQHHYHLRALLLAGQAS
jgi:hypothetical protein